MTDFIYKNDELYRELLDSLVEGVYFTDTDRKILFWNRGAEKITGFAKDEVEGSHCWDNVLMHIDEQGNKLCTGSCPLAQAMQDNRVRETEAFLHHKSGHRVPVVIKTIPVKEPDGKAIGAVEIFSNNSSRRALDKRIEELEKLALIDELTSMPNRRFIEMELSGKLNQMHRYGWGLGVIFMDLDNFKEVNDAYGHNRGDDLLKMVSRSLMLNSRSFDTPGRWGGEEFVIISDNVDAQQLRQIAERYRVLVESSILDSSAGSIQTTISAGATLAEEDDTLESIIERADGLMYESKRRGKNKVTLG